MKPALGGGGGLKFLPFDGRALTLACSLLFAALSPSRAAEQTLAVSLNGGNFEVSVPANAYDDTSKLYIVWGVADHGAEISAWPRANRCAYAGALSASAATYQISADGIPAGSVVRAIVTSDVRLIDSWVSLGNGQYVNTGIKGNEAYGTEFKFRRTGSTGAWASVMGSTLDNFTIGQNSSSTTSCYLRYRTVNGGLAAFSWTDSSVPHTILLKHSFNDGKGHVNAAYVDGTKVTLTFLDNKNKVTTGPSGALGSDAGDIFVGSSNNGSGASSGRYCFGEWHYVKIYDSNGYDMLHLVPAIRGNASSPEGVFYDKVTGTVFANAGSGALGYDTSANVTETISFTTACSAALPMSMTARWTGEGVRDNVNDPDNWSCTDATGATVVSAPDAHTLVKIEGATTFNVPAGQTLSCASLELNNVSLAGDCDWSGLAAVDMIAPVYALQYLDAPKGAYIDTGFAPNNNTRVVFDVTVRSTLESWFGITDDTSGYWWRISVFGVSNDGKNVYSGWGNLGGGNGSPVANGRHTLDYDKGVFKVDGTVHTTHSGQTFQLQRSLYLFADHRPNDVNIKANNPAVRFHSCQIYDNGTLVRDYVPVLYGDEVRLFDKVNREYALNIGTGSFEAGPSLGEKVDFHRATCPAAFDSTIDLAGRKLTLSHLSGTGVFTDTVGGGELHVNAAAGKPIENSTVSFAGQMKLVKEGAGVFTASKAEQTYTGGTVVASGLAKSGVAAGPWGPSKALVTVADTGAAFDWNGVVGASATPYSFDINGMGVDNGGAIVFTPPGTEDVANYQAYCLADLSLSGDALVVDPSANDKNRYCGFIKGAPHVLTLNGHTLTVKAGSKFNFVGVTAANAGTIAFITDATDAPDNRMASFWGQNPGEDNILTDVVLDVAANIKLNTDNDGRSHVVGTFVDRGVKGQGSRHLTVLDRFKPMTAALNSSVVLGDATHLAPVLDLSGISKPFTLPSDGYAMSLADGAAVKVDIGNRAVAVGDKLVSWSANPEWSWTLVYSGEERNIEAVARADGLYAKSTAVPTYARLDLEPDPHAWRFYSSDGTEDTDWDGDVTQEMQVRFSSYEEYLAVRAANVTPSEYLLAGGFTLPAGEGVCDMSSGFAFDYSEGLTIDAKGRALKLPAAMVGGTKPFTVTSSVAGGELAVDVAADETLTNSVMSLAGSLKLVKEGSGTFVAAKAGQTYTGGTEATAGWLKSGVDNGAWGPAKAWITIADGAAFDWSGMVTANTQTPYSFNMAGDGPGNAGAMISSKVVDASGWYQMHCIADMELSGDATIVMPEKDSGVPGFMYKDSDDQHLLTLNGHTLTIKHGCRMGFRFVKTVGQGTIANIDNGDNGSAKGISVYAVDDKTDLGSATLDVGLGGAVHAESRFTVGTFIDRRAEYKDYRMGVAKDAEMTILDRFRPMTPNLLKNIKLGDATHRSPVLDLSGLSEPFPLPSPGGFAMNLADDATIKIEIGRRSIASKLPVVSWSAKNPPANVGSLRFVRGDADRNYTVTVKEDGVYLGASGFAVIVR